MGALDPANAAGRGGYSKPGRMTRQGKRGQNGRLCAYYVLINNIVLQEQYYFHQYKFKSFESLSRTQPFDLVPGLLGPFFAGLFITLHYIFSYYIILYCIILPCFTLLLFSRWARFLPSYLPTFLPSWPPGCLSFPASVRQPSFAFD